MPFKAKVVRVLVASPGDMADARSITRETIFLWNGLHAESTGLLFWPLMWERDSVPEMGGSAQTIINRQLVDRADALIATFWTRLGTPTEQAASGTAEEIDEAVKAGKPVHVYFSSQPVELGSINTTEYERLKEFRTLVEAKGLVDEFESPDELARKVNAALTHDARENFSATTESLIVADSGSRAMPSVRAEKGQRVRTDSRGRIATSTDWALVIRNDGTAAAEDLTFELVPVSEGDHPPIVLEADHPIGRLAPGGEVSFHLVVAMQMALQSDVLLRWKENGQEFTDSQTIRL
jgi:nucleoside 2-deoxyribosyltransferase